MKAVGSLASARPPQETVLTIGAFDGVHLGHQSLVRDVVARAHDTDRLAALITFHPHPATVLAPDRAFKYLTTPAEKAVLLDAMGLDLLVLLPFDRQMAEMPALDFMTAVSRQLRFRELWIGTDFALGRSREGDVALLSRVGRELGFEVHVTDPVTIDGQIVSSSRIRALLRQGRVEDATQLLGRYYSVPGRVARGLPQGWAADPGGANLDVCLGRAVPAGGRYAVLAVMGTQRIPAVANVGVHSGRGDGEPTGAVQIWVSDAGQARADRVYGCHLEVEFVRRLWSARQCQDVGDSKAQIESDIRVARQMVERMPQERSRSQAPHGGLRSLTSACPYRYEEVEHTADLALRVWGTRLQDLFAGAARGMYSLMADVDGLIATTWRRVRLEDWDRSSLLVAWLNDLLFLTEVEGLLFVEYRIKSLTETALMAQVGGMPGPLTKAAIKAATFHDLTLVRGADEWATEITFDV